MSTPLIRVWKTRRSPVRLPWTRTCPPTEAATWQAPGRAAASASTSDTVRIRAVSSDNRVAVTGQTPATTTCTGPAVATRISAGDHLPTSHGRPDACESTRGAAQGATA